MKNTFKLIILGLITFIFFLLATAPATLITKPTSKYSEVKFEHVAGSIWNGQAQQIRIAEVPLGSVRWKINPWQIFLGQLPVYLEIGAADPDAKLSGKINMSLRLSGQLVAENSQLRATAVWVATQAALPIAPKGDVLLNINHLVAERTGLPKINAKLSWIDAGITYPGTIELGAYHIDIQHQPDDQPDKIMAIIRDVNSMLKINGNAEMDAAGQYTLDVTLKEEKYASGEISSMLDWMGRQADGSVKVKRQGNLQSWL